MTLLKSYFYLLLLLCFSTTALTGFSQNAPLIVRSPDSNITVEVSLHEKIYYRVFFNKQPILQYSPLSLKMDNGVLGAKPVLLNQKTISVNHT
ncbi:MAG TPA: glycoside hydrolase family 97 N-terminal domain-containing protein [Flavisolibacter sp.]|jgi:hypothetical protein|nr:glycoside hydrolase family 97 N-terminal domain-containing protein [Flavisolibacter sp.]